jgi:hypothetical protein
MAENTSSLAIVNNEKVKDELCQLDVRHGRPLTYTALRDP